METQRLAILIIMVFIIIGNIYYIFQTHIDSLVVRGTKKVEASIYMYKLTEEHQYPLPMQIDEVAVKDTEDRLITEVKKQDLATSVPLVYVPPPSANISTYGKRFNVSQTIIDYMDIPPKQFFKLNEETVMDFVFVTAADSSHFRESEDAIASIQTHFPGYKVHFYDLGLQPDQREELQTWCHVTMHEMDMSPFPPHVSTFLSHCCWKYLVIQEALNKVHGAVFWVDVSFRSLQPMDQWTDMYDLALRNGGFVMPEPPSRILSNYAWTNPLMYQYLPTNVETQKRMGQTCACVGLIYNTEFVYHNILHWHYLCSLDKDCCITNSDLQDKNLRKMSNFTKEECSDPTVYKEHRYDQSAINIILSNLHGYNQSMYTLYTRHFNIYRYPSNRFNVTKC